MVLLGYFKEDTAIAKKVNWRVSDDTGCGECIFCGKSKLMPRVCEHHLSEGYATDSYHKCDNYSLDPNSLSSDPMYQQSVCRTCGDS